MGVAPYGNDPQINEQEKKKKGKKKTFHKWIQVPKNVPSDEVEFELREYRDVLFNKWSENNWGTVIWQRGKLGLYLTPYTQTHPPKTEP